MTPRSKTRSASQSSTRLAIMDAAERLAQTQGFNGFSYADIAVAVGVTKASLHYHFPSKAELGYQLIERYAQSFRAALQVIDAGRSGARPRLEQYVKLYADVLRGQRMCLCGMFAAEQATLPPRMRISLREFFNMNERWIAGALASGRRAGELQFKGSVLTESRLLVSGLEGAMLVAHAYGDVARFEVAGKRMLRRLETR